MSQNYFVMINSDLKTYPEMAALKVAISEDIVKYLQYVRKPSTKFKNASETSVSKTRKKRKKRTVKKDEVLVAQPMDSQLLAILNEDNEIEHQAANANKDLITMKEAECPQKRTDFEVDNLRGLGDFGILQDGNEPLPPDFVSTNTFLEGPVTPKTSKKRNGSIDLAETPTKKVNRRGRTINFDEIIVAPSSEQPIEPPSEVQEQQPIEVLQEKLIEPTQDQPIEEAHAMPKRKLAKKGKTINLAKTLIKIQVRHPGSTFQCEEDDLICFESTKSEHLCKPMENDIDILNLVAIFVSENEEKSEFLMNLQTSARASLLKSFRMIEHGDKLPGRDIRTGEMPLVVEKQIAEVEVHPVPTKRRKTTLTEPAAVFDVANIPEIDIQTVLENLPPPDITIITEIPPVASIADAPVSKKFIVQKSLTTEERRKRLKTIKQTVKQWNIKDQGEITIEDVCVKPINRYNIATTFNDLLIMHKMEYVVLLNKPDSLELGSIEKGKNLYKKK